MGCGCGNGPKKYKHEKLKTKKKSIKTAKIAQKKSKPKPEITSKINVIRPEIPVVSNLKTKKTGKPSKNTKLLRNCPLCRSPMREVVKLGDGKYMECVSCRYSRKNVN